MGSFDFLANYGMTGITNSFLVVVFGTNLAFSFMRYKRQNLANYASLGAI